MKRFIEYPSIEQFRNVCQDMSRADFVGLDEDGNPIYDRNKPKPVVTFKGTVKLHGTNAGVGLDSKGIFVQSRTQIITPQNDNAGFASFVNDNIPAFENLFAQIKDDHGVTDETIMIFGEWAGANIQKNVAITNLPKSFFIFDICIVTHEDENITKEWIDIKDYSCPSNKIYNIEHYPTWTIDIDFNNPALKQNDLIDITLSVESECPVAKAFGFSGIGEGVVWKAIVKGKRHVFKVKGEKHSASKVKTLANVDVDKINSIVEFADYAVTDNRVNQAIENVFGPDPIDIKKLGDVIRWVVNDVAKEESDTLAKNNLTDKDVNKYLSDRVRKIFTKKLNDMIMQG
jgi:RNA ligase